MNRDEQDRLAALLERVGRAEGELGRLRKENAYLAEQLDATRRLLDEAKKRKKKESK